MAYAVAQTVNGGQNGGTLQNPTATFIDTLTLNSIIIACVDWGDSTSSITGSGLTDTALNTYNVVPGTLVQANTLSSVIYWAKNPTTTSGNVLTAHFSIAVPGPDVFCIEVTGFGTTTVAVDKSSNKSGTSGIASSVSITTTVANSFLVAIGEATGSIGTSTAGWTSAGTLNGNSVEYLIATSLTTTTAPYTGTSGDWVMSLMDFIDASATNPTVAANPKILSP